MLVAHLSSQGAGVIDLPAWALAYGVFVGAVITILWSRSRHIGRPAPRNPPVPAHRVGPRSTAGWIGRIILRTGSLCTLLLLIAFAWFGPSSIAQNVAPLAFIGVFWSLGAWAALIVGPFWNRLSPLDLVAELADRHRSDRDDDRAPWWSPAPVFASLAIIWIAWVDGDQPRHLAVWLTVYAVVMTVVAWRFGRRTLRRWEALGATLDLAGGIVHPGRSDGSLRTATDRRRSGLLAAMLTGAIGADRAMGSGWFLDHVDTSGTVATTIAATGMAALLTSCVLALWRGVERPLESARAEPGRRPIAAAAAPAAASLLLSHGLVVGLIEAQNLVVLASDPLARGWNLFGTVFWEVSQQPISPFVAGVTQATVILAGHLASIAAIGRAATARSLDGTTSVAQRRRSWNAALPAMALVVVSGIVWTLLLLGR